jgi:hypothetical protein
MNGELSSSMIRSFCRHRQPLIVAVKQKTMDDEVLCTTT